MSKTFTRVCLPIAKRNQPELRRIDEERERFDLSRGDYLFERSRQLRELQKNKRHKVTFNQ